MKQGRAATPSLRFTPRRDGPEIARPRRAVFSWDAGEQGRDNAIRPMNAFTCIARLYQRKCMRSISEAQTKAHLLWSTTREK